MKFAQLEKWYTAHVQRLHARDFIFGTRARIPTFVSCCFFARVQLTMIETVG